MANYSRCRLSLASSCLKFMRDGGKRLDQEEGALPAERALFYASMAAGDRVMVSWVRTWARSRFLKEIADEDMMSG